MNKPSMWSKGCRFSFSFILNKCAEITGTKKASVGRGLEKIPSVSNQHLPASTQIEHYEPRCGQTYCGAALLARGGVGWAVAASSGLLMGRSLPGCAPQSPSSTHEVTHLASPLFICTRTSSPSWPSSFSFNVQR